MVAMLCRVSEASTKQGEGENSTSSSLKSFGIAAVEHESERIERAERRHLRAVKMLATVRKMALPLRIDIKAEVNVSEQKTSVGSASRFDLLDLVN